MVHERDGPWSFSTSTGSLISGILLAGTEIFSIRYSGTRVILVVLSSILSIISFRVITIFMPLMSSDNI